ncbi:MAG: HAMP domain-containing protein [Acidimicrobiia bacterium]|nr:HAMP domain-containing protein [Acidimicrobiia bacterium]
MNGGAGDAPASAPDPAGVAVARRLPNWLGSVRVRLAVTYSCVLFGLAVVTIGAIYAAQARALAEAPVSRRVVEGLALRGDQVLVLTGERVDPYLLVEREANERALATLRGSSAAALGGLFVASLVVGWFVAGRVLGPVERITAVARDISSTDLSRRIDLGGPHDELRQLADTFDEMLERLDAAFAQQQRFIQEASHELRNPLAVIRTNLDVALADPTTPPGELRRTAEVVLRATERISALVDDLVATARNEDHRTVREPVDLARLVTDAADDVRGPAEEAGVAVEVAVEPTQVVGDPDGLRRAMANLVANGLRYSPVGATLRLSCRTADGGAELEVRDWGPGLDDEAKAHVFDRFWQADPERGRAEGRSGLGLAIVAQVAADHDGRATVESTAGEGAAFRLWLPTASPG